MPTIVESSAPQHYFYDLFVLHVMNVSHQKPVQPVVTNGEFFFMPRLFLECQMGKSRLCAEKACQ